MRDGYLPAAAGAWIEHAMEKVPDLIGSPSDLEKLSFYINVLGYHGRPSPSPYPFHGGRSGLAEARADAVVVLSRDCRVQTFPSDLSSEPIRLRFPFTSVAFRVAMEHVAHRLWTAAGRPVRDLRDPKIRRGRDSSPTRGRRGLLRCRRSRPGRPSGHGGPHAPAR